MKWGSCIIYEPLLAQISTKNSFSQFAVLIVILIVALLIWVLK